MAVQQYDDEDEDSTTDTPEQAADESADTSSSGDEDSDEAEEAGAAAPEVDDTANTPSNSANSALDSEQVPDWKAYLAKKYALDQGVKDARQNAQDDQRTAGIFQGISQMFGHSNDNFYNNLRAQATQRLAQASQDRQQGLQDLLTQRNVGRQDVLDALKNQETKNQLAIQSQTLKTQAALNSPDSAESDFARSLAKQFDPNGAAAGKYDATKDANGNTQGLTAAQIQRELPMVKDIYDQTMRQQDMRLRWAQLNDQRQWQRDYKQMELNRPFIQSFNTAENKYQDAVGKIDQTTKMVDQATGTGGVAATLVPLEVAREIAGRLNPQEIAAAGGDPSTVGKIDRMISTASEGKMDGVDAAQFRALLQSQRDSLSTAREKQRSQNIGSWATNTHQDPKQLRMMLLGDTGSAPAATGLSKAQPSLQDQQALEWVNDPANAKDPALPGVKATLQKKGLL